MNPWRRTRTEMAGVWRSVRYDFGGRPAPAPDDAPAEVTSTGLNTFGGPLEEGLSSGYPVVAASRPPRRLAAVGVFGVLAIAGAAGSYLTVVDGLGPLMADKPAGAGSPAPAAAAPAAGAKAGLGEATGRAPLKGGTGGGEPAISTPATTPPPAPSSTVAGVERVAPRHAAATTAPHTRTPPVPTPTAVRTPTSSPSPADDDLDPWGDDRTSDPRDGRDWPGEDEQWQLFPNFPRFRPHRNH
jgi:hypothetical protein